MPYFTGLSGMRTFIFNHPLKGTIPSSTGTLSWQLYRSKYFWFIVLEIFRILWSTSSVFSWSRSLKKIYFFKSKQHLREGNIFSYTRCMKDRSSPTCEKVVLVPWRNKQIIWDDGHCKKCLDLSHCCSFPVKGPFSKSNKITKVFTRKINVSIISK